MADQNNKNVDALAQEITLKKPRSRQIASVHFMDGRARHRRYLGLATYSSVK